MANPHLIKEALIDWHTNRISMIQEINERPLYPNESVLWDPNVVPTMHREGGDGGTVLALPKLNLQV